MFDGIAWLKRGPTYAIANLAIPLALLFLIGLITNGKLIPYAVAGGMIVIVSENTLIGVGDNAFKRLELRLQDLLVATPIGPIDYLLGTALGYFIFTMPGILLYLVLGVYFQIFTLATFLVTFVLVALLSIMIMSFAFWLSTLIQHMRNVWGFVSILSVLFTVLPPVFYPYTILPTWLLGIFMVSPATPAAMIVQGITGLAPFNPLAVVWFAIEFVIYTALGVKFVKWRQK